MDQWIRNFFANLLIQRIRGPTIGFNDAYMSGAILLSYPNQCIFAIFYQVLSASKLVL